MLEIQLQRKSLIFAIYVLIDDTVMSTLVQRSKKIKRDERTNF